jgi:hypothetical protein
MATVGLKGIWGLEQLDKTGLATWKLGLMLMGVAAPVGYILTKLLSGMEPNPVFGPKSLQVLTGETFGLVFIPAGIVVILLALARAVEMDLKALALVDDVVDASIERLRPKRALRFTCIALGLLYGYLLFPILYSDDPRLNLTVLESLIALASGGPELIFSLILNPFGGGLLTGLAWAVIISQINSLVHAARHIKIDFLQLNDYAAIANPGVRLFLCLIPILVAVPLMTLYANDPTNTANEMQLLLFFVILAVVMLLPYTYPVWVLRNRIRDKKIAEMDQITRSLRGDDDAMSKISIQGRGAPTTTVDLLMHQMFIESRWEWPIASHVQKLILFGLLPPLTWVVAAMIENAMY